MIEILRDLPISFFLLVNPFLWLFLLSPPLVFWFRRHRTDPDGIGWSIVLAFVTGWALALAFNFGTDGFLWYLASAREPIPPAWESYLFGDGGRNVFTLYFGWAYSLVVLVLWSPLLLTAAYVARRTRRRTQRQGPPAA